MDLPERITAASGAGGEGDGVGEILCYPGVTANGHGDADSPVEAFIKSRKAGDGRDSCIWRLKAAAKLMGYDDYLTCPFERWRRPQMLALRNKLARLVDEDQYVPRTAREILGNVKSVLREAWRQGYIETSDELERAMDLPKIGGAQARREVLTATDVDITRCLIVCEANRAGLGIRDAALIALSSVTGLRSIEYHALDLADIDREAQTITVRRGKGRRNRLLHFGASYLPYLDDYLKQRGTEPGAFFVRLKQNGSLWRGRPERLSVEAIRLIFVLRSTQAGRPLPSHAFRRGAATRVVDLTGNSALASAILGHASKVTLDLYYNPEHDTKKQAAEQVIVPGPAMYAREYVKAEPDEPPVAPVIDRLAATLAAMVAAQPPKEG